MSWRRKIILLSLLPSGLCLFLGLWQLDRLEWKKSLLREIAARCESSPAQRLPAVKKWGAQDEARWAWRRIRLTGRFDESQSVQLYKAGRWHKITAMRVDGGFILVDRGIEQNQRRGQKQKTESLEAVLWPSSQGGFFDPAEMKATAEGLPRFFVRDVQKISAILEISPVFALMANLSLSCPRLRNPHLGYALTWFALMIALPLVALFGEHAKKKWNEPKGRSW